MRWGVHFGGCTFHVLVIIGYNFFGGLGGGGAFSGSLGGRYMMCAGIM